MEFAPLSYPSKVSFPIISFAFILWIYYTDLLAV